MSISAIIFDCDGVLVDSEVLFLEVEMKFLAQLGLHYEIGAYQKRFIGLTMTDYFSALNSDLLALGKGSLPPGFEEDLVKDSMARIEAELQMIPGADILLEQFSGSIAVASSSSVVALHKKLKLTGLHRHFHPHIYSSDYVSSGKPAPDLFLHTAQKIGKDPGECIVIEDSENGVQAGRAAGMKVWGFTGGGHADRELATRLRDAGAHEVFGSFAEVQSAL